MSRREDGQVMVAGVGIALLVIAAALVLVHLAVIRSQSGHGQTAADVAALAAAKVLSQDPTASPSQAITAAGAAAKANGARVSRFQIDRASGVPTSVDVQVTETASGDVPGVGRRNDVVTLTSRAGVVYPPAPRPGAPLPLNLAGTRGGAAVVRAAEAQIGWPYVWGGESRAEGGFDCSGLVDYAYAAAGRPLGGRPTSESLWAMAQHITEGELEPGDLVFLGAASGQPYHVGIYAGGGMTVVAPHTGAFVELEPLSADGWDGFGRLIKGNSAAAPVVTGSTEDLARKYEVPPTVLEAAEQVGVDHSPLDLAQRLSTAMRAHGGNVVDALAAVLGSRQAAGAVMAAVSARPAETTGSVELLPRTVIRWRGPRSHGSSWSGLTSVLQSGSDYLRSVSEAPEEERAGAHGRGIAGLLTSVLGNVGGGIGAVVQTGQAVWDAVGGVADAVDAVAAGVSEFSTIAGPLGWLLPGFNIGLGILGAAGAAMGFFRARSWWTRAAYGVQFAASVGAIAFGVAQLAVLAGLALTAPAWVPVALAVVGVAALVATVWLNRSTLWSATRWAIGGVGRAWDACTDVAGSATSTVASAVKSVANRATHTLSSVTDSLNPFS